MSANDSTHDIVDGQELPVERHRHGLRVRSVLHVSAPGMHAKVHCVLGVDGRVNYDVLAQDAIDE